MSGIPIANLSLFNAERSSLDHVAFFSVRLDECIAAIK